MLLAIIAGFVATIAAGVARHVLISKVWGAGPTYPGPDRRRRVRARRFARRQPRGQDMLHDIASVYSGVWVGTLAGVVVLADHGDAR